MQVLASKLIASAVYVAIHIFVFVVQSPNPLETFFILLPTLTALWYGLFEMVFNSRQRKWYHPDILVNLSLTYYSIKGVPLTYGFQSRFQTHLDFDTIISYVPEISVYTLLGILAFNHAYRYCARYIGARRSYKERLRAGQKQPRTEAYSLLGVVTLGGIGVASALALFNAIGQDPFVFLRQSWIRGYLSDSSVTGSQFGFIFLTGSYFTATASLVWLALLRGRPRIPIMWWIYTVLAIGFLFLVSSRAIILGYIISIATCYTLTRRMISPRAIVVFMFFAFFYSYSVHRWRSITNTMEAPSVVDAAGILASDLSTEGFLDFMSGEALSDIRVFVIIMHHYSDPSEWKYGDSFARIFYQFIPRGIWSDKPYDLGLEIAQHGSPYTRSGVPPGFIPELYMNFHLFGVLIGSMVLGLVLAHVYTYLLHPAYPHTTLHVLLYSVLAQRLILLPSNTISIFFFVILIPMAGCLFAFYLSRYIGRRRYSVTLLSPAVSRRRYDVAPNIEVG